MEVIVSVPEGTEHSIMDEIRAAFSDTGIEARVEDTLAVKGNVIDLFNMLVSFVGSGIAHDLLVAFSVKGIEIGAKELQKLVIRLTAAVRNSERMTEATVTVMLEGSNASIVFTDDLPDYAYDEIFYIEIEEDGAYVWDGKSRAWRNKLGHHDGLDASTNEQEIYERTLDAVATLRNKLLSAKGGKEHEHYLQNLGGDLSSVLAATEGLRYAHVALRAKLEDRPRARLKDLLLAIGYVREKAQERLEDAETQEAVDCLIEAIDALSAVLQALALFTAELRQVIVE